MATSEPVPLETIVRDVLAHIASTHIAIGRQYDMRLLVLDKEAQDTPIGIAKSVATIFATKPPDLGPGSADDTHYEPAVIVLHHRSAPGTLVTKDAADASMVRHIVTFGSNPDLHPNIMVYESRRGQSPSGKWLIPLYHTPAGQTPRTPRHIVLRPADT